VVIWKFILDQSIMTKSEIQKLEKESFKIKKKIHKRKTNDEK